MTREKLATTEYDGRVSTKGNGGTSVQERVQAELVVTIDNAVLAQIARLAASEIKGVHALEPTDAIQGAAELLKRMVGGHAKGLGVRVEQGRIECAVDLRMTVEYGASIPRVSREVRRAVDERISRLTGFRLVELNMTIVGLHFPEHAPQAESTRALR